MSVQNALKAFSKSVADGIEAYSRYRKDPKPTNLARLVSADKKLQKSQTTLLKRLVK